MKLTTLMAGITIGSIVTLGLTGTILAGAAPEDREDPATAGASASWLSEVEQKAADSEYEVTWQNKTSSLDLESSWQAPNRAHNFRTYFAADGIRMTPRIEGTGDGEPSGAAASWEWSLSLARWGWAGATTADLAPARLRVDGNRVEYDRGSLVESYVNDRRGLKQGFTIVEAPASQGDVAETGGLVHLDLALGGTLAPVVAADGQEIDFATPLGSRVLHYVELRVEDARGRVLRSWMEGFSEPGLSGIRIVYEDAGAAYPVTVDPLATSAAWTVESDQASAEFGDSVATAGDVNDDGYADVIVGARFYDNGQTDEGRAYVYLGSAAGLATSAAWTAESDQVGAVFGWSVATAGDVNGDGYSDVIVGARLYNNGHTDEGRAFVYHGSAAGLSTSPAWTAESNQVLGRFGYSVATAGDVNDDGYDDVIVGATGFSNPQVDEGRAYFYLGSAVGLATSPAWTDESDQANANFGYSVATAGDVDGDGYADVIVAAYRYDNGETDEGRAYVYLGSAAGLATSAAWTAESDQSGGHFGVSVATAGDVNDDGYADVIVGAHVYDNGETDEGRVYVYHGSAAGLATSAAWTAESNQANAAFGWSVATAGDVNDDGYDDVIVGARLYNNGQADKGRAYAYHGSAAGLSTSPGWVAEGDQASAEFGNSVATAGDVNGDGYDDVIVGAWQYDNGQADEGRVYVYLGSAEDACVSGGDPIVCDDGSVCTTDSCNSVTGCVFTNNTAPCDDGLFCTVNDLCNNGTCAGVPGDCNENNRCTADSCDEVNDTCVNDPGPFEANPCDDGDVCTYGDSCAGGTCVGTAVPTPSEASGVTVDKSGADAIIAWTLANDSTTSDVLRGDIASLPVGPVGDDEVCLGNTGATTMTDSPVPAADSGVWYLIRGVNACAGNGTYGFQGVGGVPGAERVSTTCP